MKSFKKIVNLRFLFISFISLIITILLSYNFFVAILNKDKLLYSVYGCLILLLFLTSFILIMQFYKTNKNNAKSINRKPYFAFIFIFLFSLFGYFSVGISFYKYSNVQSYVEEKLVCATISDKVSSTNSGLSLKTSKISIIDNGIKKDLNYNANIYLYTSDYVSASEIKAGTTIVFYSAVVKNSLNLENYIQLGNGYAYTFRLNYYDVAIESGKSESLSENFRERVKSLLLNNMNEENAGIAYSVLFGDKSLISSDIKNAFSYSGLAHVLAVSGLHIGFLVALMVCLLRLFKLNDVATFCVIVFILILYSSLCGFTSSVVRASIMSVVMLFSKIVKRKYDSLNSLSIAGIIILLFKPSELFNVGFQLSFLCVYSIITIAPYLTKFLNKLKMPKSVSSSVAITFSTTIALLPLMAINFNQLSILSVVSNMLILPVFSISYSLLFVLSLICLCFPFVGFLLKVPDIIFQFIKVFANFISELPYSVLLVFKISYWALFLIILFAFVIKFVMLKTNLKLVLSAVVFAMFLIAISSGFISSSFINNSLCVNVDENNNNQIVVTSSNGTTTLIGFDNYNSYSISSFLLNKKISHIDNYVCFGLKQNNVEVVNNITKKFSIDNIVCDGLFNFENNCNIYNDFNNLDLNFSINPIYNISGNTVVGIIITKENYNYVFAKNNLSNQNLSLLFNSCSENIVFINFDYDNIVYNYLTNATIYNFNNQFIAENNNDVKVINCDSGFVNINI